MFEDIRTALTELRDYVAWMPDSLVSAAMLALAALVALVVHSIVIRLTLRLMRERHPNLRSFLAGTKTSLVVGMYDFTSAHVLDTVKQSLADKKLNLVLDHPAIGVGGPVSSHGLGLDDAVGLGRALDRMPGRLIVHAVEAGDLGQGAGLTPAVAATIDTLAAAVRHDLDSLRRHSV